MTYETIRFEIDSRQVAYVTLNRRTKHNAMNAAMIAELSDGAGMPDVRVVVLRSEGKTFCAGGDLGWMKAHSEKDRAGKLDEAMALARMLGLWDALPRPVVARVQGAAYGGGLG